MTLGQLVMNWQHAGSHTVSNRCVNSDRIFTNVFGNDSLHVYSYCYQLNCFVDNILFQEN